MTPADLNYVPGPAQFEYLARSTLGEHGTAADGFDALHAQVSAQHAADSGEPAILDYHLARASFRPGQLVAERVNPLVNEHGIALRDYANAVRGVDTNWPYEPGGHGTGVSVSTNVGRGTSEGGGRGRPIPIGR